MHLKKKQNLVIIKTSEHQEALPNHHFFDILSVFIPYLRTILLLLNGNTRILPTTLKTQMLIAFCLVE